MPEGGGSGATPLYYNSVVAIDSGGEIVDAVDKVHLVPFGEYLPFADVLDQIGLEQIVAGPMNFAAGAARRAITLPGSLKALPFICYEIIFPDLVDAEASSADVLVTVTNDAWFGDTSEPWEHMALSVFRAVEMRTDLVRAVNTGVSAFIDAGGHVRAKTYAVDPARDPRGVDTLLGQVALMEGGHTFYARFGEVFATLCVIITAGLWLVWPRIRRK